MTDDKRSARLEMTRREVNLSLLSAAFAVVAGLPASACAAPVHLFDFAMAGASYYDLRAVLPGMRLGARLALIREPNNPHDANAVAVHTEAGAKLGFIPRKANPPIAQLLDAGYAVRAEVKEILKLGRHTDLPKDLVFTCFVSGDPVIRLTTSPLHKSGTRI